MIVRKLAPAEYYRAHLVQAVAFEGNSEYQKEKEEAENELLELYEKQEELALLAEE